MTITDILMTINHQGLILFEREESTGGGVPPKPNDGSNGKGGMSENAGGGGEGVALTRGGNIEDGGEGTIAGGGCRKGFQITGGLNGFGGSVKVF